MGHVYRNASEVIVWLGPAADSSNTAMQQIRFRSKLNPNIMREPEEAALKALFSRPYWDRV